MSYTHRGVPFPEVVREDGWYRILDEKYGWFEAYTPTEAYHHWMNKVDTVLTREFVADGSITLHHNETYMCNKCGALLGDVFLHLPCMHLTKMS